MIRVGPSLNNFMSPMVSFELEVATENVVDSGIRRVELRLDEGMHDELRLHFVGGAGRRLSTLSEVPVSFKWTKHPLPWSAFVGYTSLVEPVHRQGVLTSTKGEGDQRSPTTSFVLTALGASYPMKSTYTRVWENRTIPSVVREIAARYRFSVDIDGHDYVWPNLLQSSESDWAYIIELGKRIGFRLLVRGTHLMFYDPALLVARATEIVPLEITESALTSTLVEFRPKLGAITAAGSQVERQLEGLDMYGRHVYLPLQRFASALGEQALTSRLVHQEDRHTAHSLDMIAAYQGGADRATRYSLAATAICVGNPLIQPAAVVDVRGVGEEYSGLWHVVSAHHIISDGNYTVEAKLERDSVGRGVVGRRRIDQQFARPSRLVDGRWVARSL